MFLGPVLATTVQSGYFLLEGLTNGTDGFIVPVRSAEAIAERLDLLASDPERLIAIKSMAKQKAASRGWAMYRQRLVEVAREVMAS